MQDGKFNVIIDAFWGSSGKGKTSTWLADKFSVTRVSSSNFPNAGHCQTADTYVITEKGLERLGDVVRAERASRVVNMDGEYEDVSAYVSDGVRKTNLITLSNGVTLECTDAHRYFVWDSETGTRQWVRSMDIDPATHQFLFPKNVSFPSGKLLPRDFSPALSGNKTNIQLPSDELQFAEYLGLLVGDGYYAKPTRVDVAFHTSQLDVLERVQAMYAEMGIDNAPVARVGDKECFVLSTGQVSGLKELLGAVGLKPATRDQKTTPAAILTSRPEVIGRYLRGLFDADGSAKKDRVTLSNCSESVVRDAQQMLYVLGVHSCVTRYDDKPGRTGSNRLPQWTLSVSGRTNLEKFRQTVGFASRVKNERLDACIASTEDQGQVIRIPRKLRASLRHLGVGTGKRGNTRTSFILSLATEVARVEGGEELLRTCEGYHVVCVKSVVREHREVEVFDLTVPGTHSYLANGCISHNTAAFEDGTKFVAKAIPTAAILKKTRGMGVECFLSPGSGFAWPQLVKEWKEAGKPTIRIHERASIVTDDHAKREREGAESTMHIASTMQGSAAAIVDKVLRKADCQLAWNTVDEVMRGFEGTMSPEFAESVSVLKADAFRVMSQGAVLDEGHTWLHEGSQGYALSIDHGSHYPFCLSGDSRVLLAGGSAKTVKMKDIEVGMTVLSKDDSGRMVPKKVVNVWKNPTGQKRWFNIVTETSVYNNHDQQWIGPKLTGDHKIQTQRGKVAVKDLTRGDQIFVNERELVEDGLQVFLGSVLGDGTVPACEKNRQRASLQISHGADQRGYALAKAAILRGYIGGSDRTIRYGASSFKEGNEQIRYQSSASLVVKRLATSLGCYGAKNPDMKAIVELIDERGLAIWYQDDGQYKTGSGNGPEVYIHTNGFSHESVETLASSLEQKFGVHFSVYTVRGVKKHGRGEREYPVLRLSRKDHDKWFAMVGRYIHSDLAYKIPEIYLGKWASSWTRPGESRCAVETVLDVVPSRDFRGMDWCYDIEVEDTHNFFVKNDKGAFNVENCTSRNCTVQAALDHMAMPPQVLGDVYLNLRTFPIRVGNVVDNGIQKGYSGDFYPDCKEMTWEQVAAESGMPAEEAKILAERERTTVTKRIRRVCNFTFVGLRDAVRTNGATKLCLNFIQYVNWEDRGLKGGRDAFEKLSKKSRAFIDRVEESANVPVVLIGTGALHDEMITLL
jgi:recombination protein RecA